MASLVSLTSSSLSVSWDAPLSPNGLITDYEVTFEPVRTAGLELPSATRVSSFLSVDAPQTVLFVTRSELQPATTYSTAITAITGGGASSGQAIELTTSESGKFPFYNTLPSSPLTLTSSSSYLPSHCIPPSLPPSLPMQCQWTSNPQWSSVLVLENSLSPGVHLPFQMES